MKRQTTYQKLLGFFGNVSATARAFKVERQEIQRWGRQGFIPWRRGEDVEKKTNGFITASEVWESAAKARKH